MTCDTLKDLIQHYNKETEWIEFKVDNKDPQMVGEYISALANSATLHNQTKAYLVYGIEDETLDLVGTKFQPKIAKKGNEELENWLHQKLDPSIEFMIYEIVCDDVNISIFEIDSAKYRPVSFDKIEYIRIGSYKKKLQEYPEKERKLWDKFSSFCFEDGIAKDDLNSIDILKMIDFKTFFNLIGIPYKVYHG